MKQITMYALFITSVVLFWINLSNAQDSTVTTNRVVRANTQFGFNLFSKLRQRDGAKNIFISPASISLALAMTYNGAEGSTQEAMSTTLGLANMSMQEVNASCESLMSVMSHPDSSVQLLIANSLWAAKGIPFKEDFLERTKAYYQAEVENLDFADPSSPEKINEWVSTHTQGKIKSIVESIPGDAILYLLNAIYFKGNWSKKFDEKMTHEKDFHLPGGGEKKVQMMSQSGHYQYLHGNNFQAVSLPYGNGRISLYIILPDSGIGISEFYRKGFGPHKWNIWMSDLRTMEGSIRLPRFKIENDLILNDALDSLGMGEAFSKSRANFSGMVRLGKTEIVYISEVRHKTFVEVNEKGSEAAAVTEVRMGMEASAIHFLEPHFNMVVDRPFFCAIRDNTTGLLLFIGSIVDP